MQPPRFTFRRMLVLIAILAVLMGIGRWPFFRYAHPGITKTYYLGDLIGAEAEPSWSAGMMSEFQTKLPAEAALLQSAITSDAWWLGPRLVKPVPTALGLAITDTEEGHQQVASWLKQRRDRLNSRQQPRAVRK